MQPFSDAELRESLKRYYELTDAELDAVLGDGELKKEAQELVQSSSSTTQALEDAKTRLARLRGVLHSRWF